jgi:nucleotide-binding universal stress UspA family protein
VPEPFGRILVPLDGSPLAHAALGPAARLARDLAAEILLMTAAGPAHVPGVATDLALQLGETDALVLLAEAAAGRELMGLPVTRLVVRGHGRGVPPPAEAIVTAVEETGADLVVMATHGRSGVRRAVLGSVADAVVARVPVPVLLVPPQRPPPSGWHPPGATERLLVALDGSPESEAAVVPAAALSHRLGATVELALVVGEGTAGAANGRGAAALEAAELRLRGAGVPARRSRSAVLQAHGRSVADTLLAYAEGTHARMLVVATHARRGLDRLRHGSVEADLLRQARLPVLVVRTGG